MTLRRLALVVLTLALLTGAMASSASAEEGVFEETTLPDYDPATYPTGPYISAEQPDYSPGHIVDIRGGGWEPGETVTLIFHPEPQVRPDTVMTATANEDGDFMHSEFLLEEVDLGTTYTVTATGESSGHSATTSFTDAATDFYFAYGSGSWNTSTAGVTVNPVWRTCTDAAGTTGCTNQGVTAPGTTANVVTIQSGVTVTITTNITADQVVVASGGALVVNAKPTFANGTGTDLTVNGTLTVNATQSATIAASGRADVNGVATLNGTVVQLASSQVNVAGDFNINSGGAVNGNGTNASSRPTFNVTSGGELSIASGGAISPSGANPLIVDVDTGGTATVAGSISGPNKIDFDGTVNATGNITMSATSDLRVGGTVTLSGTSVLTTTRTNSGTVATIVADGSLKLTDTAQWSITGNAGAHGDVANNGTLEMDPSAFVTGAGFLDVNAGGHLIIGSDVGINDGTTTGNLRTTATDTFANTAEYTFDGAAAQITGNALKTPVAILEVDNSDGVTLSNIGATSSAARTVTDELHLTDGDLSTGANILTLDGGTTCSGTGDVVSTGVGGVFRDAITTGGAARCFGNPNNKVQLASGGTAPDVTMKLVKSAPTSPAFSSAVQRTYTVTPTGGSGYSATLTLHYNTGDLNGNTESDLELWRSDGTAWTKQGRTGAVDTVNKAVSLSGVTQFSDWTLAAKTDQTITFNAPSGVTYGDADFDLGATASSNLPVSYTSNTTGVCTIVSGLLHIVSAGNCSVTASQAGDASYNAAPDETRNFDIDPKELTVEGITAEGKDYDGNTNATINTAGATLVGVVGSDDVTLDVSGASGAFDTKDVGTGKTVQISGLTLDGTDTGNYSLTQPTTTADIDPKELTVDGITAEDKDYDGNTNATIDTTSALLQGVVGTEDVTLDTSGATGAFDTKDVGLGKTVQIAGLTLDGTETGNYSLTQPTTTADIDPKELTVDGITAEDKDYDGNRTATIDTTSALLVGVVGTEDVTLDTSGATGEFDTKDVGLGKTVQIAGLTLDGTETGNYSLTQPTTTADIDPKELTVTGITAEDKDYDGNRTATIDTSGAILHGVVDSEDVTLDTSGATGEFDTKDAGEDKTVQISGLALDGTETGNYSLTQPTTTADIDPKELTVTGITAEDKDYDGNTNATIDTTGATLVGVVGTEDVTLNTSGASGAFDTKDAGEDKTVQIAGLTLDGTETGNYSLTQPTTTADIDRKELTVTGITADNKEYDTNRNATIDTAGATLVGVVGTEDVTLDTSGASGEFDTKDVGTNKTVQISGLTLDGTETGNYSLTQPSTTADITPAELAVNAQNKTRAFNEPNPTPTYSLSGFKGTEDKTSANVTGDADCSYDSGAGPNAGVYPNAITCEPGNLAAPNYTFATGSKGTLTITAANTTITYSGDTTEQYSDKTHLKATLTSAGVPLEGRTVTFKLGPQDLVSDVTDADGVAELDLKVDQAPAVTFVVARFAGEQNYSQSSTGAQTFTVTAEDARALYTGFLDVATSSATSSTANVTLSATIRDITGVSGDPAYDTDEGDIRKAKVDFIDRDTNAVLCNDLGVGLVSAADTKVGTATCNWSASISPGDYKLFTIGIRVEGWYTRNDSSENVVVNVYKPLTTAFITGGGFLVNQASGGLYPGDQGKKTNFGFGVKYNKSGTNLQGNINAIIRKGAYTYQVKGNAMTSLTSKVTTSPKTATFAGKANIQDITNPLLPSSIDGNATLQVTMSDYGTPGSSDKIGITVLNKAGGLWFSSNWSGVKTLEQLLGGGNLTVR